MATNEGGSSSYVFTCHRPPQIPQGKIFALEGIDGSGKTSVVNYLKSVLPADKFTFTREPCESCYRDILMESINSGDEVLTALLFAADHRKHIETVVKPALEAGKHVITDRYLHSHLAYQTVMLSSEMSDPQGWLNNIYASSWTKAPDYVLYFDINPEEAEARIRKSRPEGKIDKYETAATLKSVTLQYDRVLSSWYGKVIHIDAWREQLDVSALVRDIIVRNTK